MEISRDLEISRVLNFLQPLENSRILDISRPPGKIQGGPYLRSDTLCADDKKEEEGEEHEQGIMARD